MVNAALELVLPWLTAQELASIAQGHERWNVPILNEVDNHLYPCFQYTRHSFVVHSPSQRKLRISWGSVTAGSPRVPPHSPSSSPGVRGNSWDKQFSSWPTKSVLKPSEVQEAADHEGQVRRLPDYTDDAVGCKCSESCVQPFFPDAKLPSLSCSEQECCGECRVTRKRKEREEPNSYCHWRSNEPQHCCGNLMSERAAAPKSESCSCGRTFEGQLAYGDDLKLRVLTTASEIEVSPNGGPSTDQLSGDSDSEYGSDLEEGPPLILECGSACSCSLECGLRVSQHGLAVRVSIVRHLLKGWCLHAAQLISVGSFVCEYAGEMITTTEARLRQRLYEAEAEAGRQRHGPSLVVLKEHLPSGKVCLRLNVDGTAVGNVSRFISHSCDGGNLYPCLIRTSGSIVPKLGLFARRNIEEGDELSYSYGTDSAKGAAYRLCLCGTAACRGMLPSEAT